MGRRGPKVRVRDTLVTFKCLVTPNRVIRTGVYISTSITDSRCKADSEYASNRMRQEVLLTMFLWFRASNSAWEFFGRLHQVWDEVESDKEPGCDLEIKSRVCQEARNSISQEPTDRAWIKMTWGLQRNCTEGEGVGGGLDGGATRIVWKKLSVAATGCCMDRLAPLRPSDG